MSVLPSYPSDRGREAALYALLAERDRAWNCGDAAAWASAFTDDARLVTLRGAVQEGREVIEEICRRALTGRQQGSHSQTTIERVSFPAANVAMVDVLHSITEPGPEARSARSRMRLMAVRIGGSDTWRLSGAQSTPLTVNPHTGDSETTLV